MRKRDLGHLFLQGERNVSQSFKQEWTQLHLTVVNQLIPPTRSLHDHHVRVLINLSTGFPRNARTPRACGGKGTFRTCGTYGKTRGTCRISHVSLIESEYAIGIQELFFQTVSHSSSY